jgi:LacI family transcriptional regulator
MTVSRVVNGGAGVREATQAAVMEAVRALQYQPNAAARSLARGGATHIGLLYANPSAAYLSDFLVGCLEGCRRAGCHLSLEASASESDTDLRSAALRLIADEVQGVVLPPPLSETAAVLEAFAASGVPTVRVAVGQPAEGSLTVSIDDFAAAREMTALLVALGHRRIGFIGGHPNQTASFERRRGFEQAMTEAGLKADPAAVEQGYFSYRSGLEAAERLLDRRPDLTAVFASNDDMAVATVNVAHRRGLRVPGDLSVAGFDDTGIALTGWPELTTIRQPIREMADTAVELLLQDLRTRRAEQVSEVKSRVLAHLLIERESTAPPVQELRRQA